MKTHAPLENRGELEGELRAALRAQAASVTSETLRHRQLPAERRRTAAPVLAVATIVTVCGVGVAIGVAARSSSEPGASGTASGGTLSVEGGMLRFAGITAPIPAGWSVRQQARLGKSTTLCLEPPTGAPSAPDPLDPACGGVTLRVADVAHDGGASTLLATGITSCRSGATTVPLLRQDVTIGGRLAVEIETTCAGNNDPVAYYWRLVDSSLTITSAGKLGGQAQQLANTIDLAGWAHDKQGPIVQQVLPAQPAPIADAPDVPTAAALTSPPPADAPRGLATSAVTSADAVSTG